MNKFLLSISIILLTIIGIPLRTVYAQDPIKAVGNLEGGLNVSNGAATYTIPIASPKGIGRAQANISIHYNAMMHSMGTAGWGWNVSAAGSISRGNQTYYLNGITRPLNMTGHQNFYLDGELLLPFEGDVATAVDYVTQSESYSKINQIGTPGNPTSWTVTQKDGTVYEYGTDESQRIATDEGVLTWMLSKVTDPLGNTIAYNYQKLDGDEILLSSIVYADKTIKFEYRDKTTPNVFFRENKQIKTTKILDKITVVAIGSSSLVYQLAYDSQLGRDYLSKVSLIGSKDGQNQELSTSFNYGDLANSSGISVTNVSNAPLGENSLILDVLGDGKNNVLNIEKVPYVENSNSNTFYRGIGMHTENIKIFLKEANGGFVEKSVLSNQPARFNQEDKGGFIDIPLYTTPGSKGKILRVKADIIYGNYTEVVGPNVIPMFEDGMQAKGIWIDEFTKNGEELTHTYKPVSIPISLGQEYAAIKYIAPAFSPFIVGDFDGNGTTDLIGVFAQSSSNEVRTPNGRAHDIDVNFTYIRKGFLFNPNTESFSDEILGLDNSILEGATQVLAVDDNGDGKQELMVRTKSDYTIYSIEPISAATGYSYKMSKRRQGHLSVDNSVAQDERWISGDFNGDGLTDILCYAPGSKNAGIFYANGFLDVGGYIQTTVTLTKEILADDLLSVIDLDGDGISDVYHRALISQYQEPEPPRPPHHKDGPPPNPDGSPFIPKGRWENEGLHHLYNFRGLSVNKVSLYDSQDVCPDDLSIADFLSLHPDAMESPRGDAIDGPCGRMIRYDYNFRTSNKFEPVLDRIVKESSLGVTSEKLTNKNAFLLAIDYKGSGFIDVVLDNNQRISSVVSESNIGNLLSITQQSGTTTSINYQPVGQVENPIYVQETFGEEHPNPLIDNSIDTKVITPALLLVQSITNPDGIGGSITQNYSYKDAVWNRGKGLLGFVEITQSSSLGSKTISKFTLNDTHHILYPSRTETYLNDVLQSTETQSFHFIPLAQGNIQGYYKMQRFKMQLVSTYLHNTLNNAVKKQSFEYDAWDNILKKTVEEGYGDGSNITALTTALTNMTYGQFGKALYPSAPAESNTVFTRGNLSTDATKTVYTYNEQGLPVSKTAMSGTPLENSISYTYTPQGQIQSSIEKSPDRADISTTFTYDAAGILPISSVRVQGDIRTETTTVYDPIWPKPISETIGVAGQPGTLTTTYTYDALGKLVSTTNPMGHTFTETTAYTSDNGATYVHTVDAPVTVAPDVREYYDALGRIIRTETLGWNEKWRIQTTTYNAKGQTISQTAPYYEGETPMVTSSEYDAQERLSKVTTPQGTGTYTYSQGSQGELTVTITDALGRSNRQITDATGLTSQSQDPGGTVNYTYDARDNVLTTSVNGAVMTTATYDTYGRQIQLTDANAGTINYTYNNAGDILSQTDARGKVINNTYDGYGRLIKRNTEEGDTQYEFYNEPNNHELKRVWNAQHDKNFVYDIYGRISSQTEIIAGNSYTTGYAYSAENHLIAITYPNGVKINQLYNTAGMLTRKLLNGKDIYANKELNGLGQVTSYTLVNGKTGSINYDDKGLPTRYHTEGIQDLNFEFESDTQNLLSRSDALKNLKETFTYDTSDRLTGATVNGTEQFKITYSDAGAGAGNITEKSNLGTYAYQTDKPNALLTVAPTAVQPAGYPNIKSVSYASFQRPLRIEAETGTVLDLSYGVDDARVQSLQTIGNSVEIRTFMGDYEIQTLPDGTVNHIIYVAGDKGLAAMVVNGNPHAVYTDYLGSILTVTDEAGNVVAAQNFDAWGRRRNVNTWTYDDVEENPTVAWLYRGYTGHEHLDAFGLINMNARLYDPYTGRMLSPDNYVGNAQSSQAYNRYSYANNNPLKYTDPTGNFVHLIVGALIGGFVNWIANGAEFSWKGLSYFGVGALSGALSAGIGAGVSSALSGASFGAGFLGTGAARVVGSGFLSGAVVGASGGFAGGFTSGLGNSLIEGQNFGQALGSGFKTGAMGAISGGSIGGVVGGIRALFEGTNFWTGEGRFESTAIVNGNGEQQIYSNESARDFEFRHEELRKLSKNVDNLSADGTVASGLSYDKTSGFFLNKKGEHILGITNRSGIFRKTTNVYLAKAAFVSKEQLYMTMHHEYMHAYFMTNNILLSGNAQHEIINQWHNSQIHQWAPYKLKFSTYYFGRVPNSLPNLFLKYGFKTIPYRP